MTQKILACRPVDMTSIPPSLMADLPVYGEGAQQSICAQCRYPIMLGPRQALAYDLTPDEYLVLCLECATLMAVAHGHVQTAHLGGP